MKESIIKRIKNVLLIELTNLKGKNYNLLYLDFSSQIDNKLSNRCG